MLYSNMHSIEHFCLHNISIKNRDSIHHQFKEQMQWSNMKDVRFRTTFLISDMRMRTLKYFHTVSLTSWVNSGLHPILHTSYQVPDDLLMVQILVCKSCMYHSYIHLVCTLLYYWYSLYLFKRKYRELFIFNRHHLDLYSMQT